MRQTNSNEFASQPDLRLPRFAKGDRVEHNESGRSGTVKEAHFYLNYWAVMVLFDGERSPERCKGKHLTKSEALF